MGLRGEVASHSRHAYGLHQLSGCGRRSCRGLRRESRYVCVANVHVTMESYDSAEFRTIVNDADLVTPDGMPLVWALRLFGVPEATRVGPTLTVHVLERAAAAGVPVGFYGATPEVLTLLLQVCQRRFPTLRVAYAHAPPFRELTTEEDAKIIREINASGARILFVGLGCPKQERWMASHREAVNAVMLGVGAAFDFLAGVKPEAPVWMQRAGLEWCSAWRPNRDGSGGGMPTTILDSSPCWSGSISNR